MPTASSPSALAASRTPEASAATSSIGTIASRRHAGIGLMTPDQVHYGQANAVHAARQLTLDAGRPPRQPGALRGRSPADTARPKNRPPPGSTHQRRKAAPAMPTRPPGIVETSRAAPLWPLFSAIAAPTRHLTRVSWTGSRCLPERTPLGTPAVDGAAFTDRPGSARSARNSSPPHYHTDPMPAVPSSSTDEPGCIKVVDTFRATTGRAYTRSSMRP